ncbi:MAG: potassium channel protein [Actinomycetota bacterium]|nr:potassium channel protein [Actinomycetota bacterium]
MNDERPRTLKAMLARAKDTSELMLDLAYAGLFYADRDLSSEVLEFEEELNHLAHEMREVCLLASRSPSDAAGLASLLQVIGSIEVIGNQAVDIAKIVLQSIGIPRELRADLAQAEELTERLAIREGSPLDGLSVKEAELAVHGARLLAVRRGPRWIFDPDDDEVLLAHDVLVVRVMEEGLTPMRELCGTGPKVPPPDEESVPLNELDRAIDILVEMKDLAEVAVGLAYAAVLLSDRGLAAEVDRIEDRLDDMRETLESWVLDAALEARARPALRGLLRLAVASESIGDAAQSMVWLIREEEELHPIIVDALGEAEDVVLQAEVGEACPADGKSLDELELEEEAGMTVLAISHRGRWRYRPTGRTRLLAGDLLVLTGPSEAIEDIEPLLAAPVPANA